VSVAHSEARSHDATTASSAMSAPAGMVEIAIPEALETAKKALQAVGWSEANAQIQAEIMTYAETCGNNQGLVKLLNPAMMAPAAGSSDPVVERDAPTSAEVNGMQAPGMLSLQLAVDLAVTKSAGGVASVGVYNTGTSSGQLAYYGARAAKAGRVVIITANSPEFVAAKAGAAATFGTNPLCFACPVEGREPFVFDMATAAIALFGVLKCKATGAPLPEGTAYDAEGNPTTDIADIHVGGGGGTIAAWGGHKGVGLALMVELLCAALAGGAVLGAGEPKKVAKNWGHHVIAIDPAAHVDGFAARAASIIKTVATSHPDGVRLPGDASAKIAAENTAKGTITIPDKVWASLTETAAKLASS